MKISEGTGQICAATRISQVVIDVLCGPKVKNAVGLIVTCTYRKRPEVAGLHRVLIPHMDWIFQPGVLLYIREKRKGGMGKTRVFI